MAPSSAISCQYVDAEKRSFRWAVQPACRAELETMWMRRDVEQRQRRGQHVVGRVALAVGDLGAVEVEEVVRVDDALGVAGGAARELDDRDVAGVRELGGGRVGAAFEPRVHGDHARAVDRAFGVAGHDDQLDLAEAVERLERRQHVLTGDEDLEVGLLDDPLEQDAAGVGVERDGDAAGRLRAVERGEELDLVAQQQADVARASEVVEQRVGEAVRLLLGLLEGEAAVGEVQPRLVRALPRPARCSTCSIVRCSIAKRPTNGPAPGPCPCGARSSALSGTRPRAPCGRRW